MRGVVLASVLACLAGSVSAETFGEIYVAQMKLNKLGFDVGKPDGQSGPATRRALAEAGAKHGFEPTFAELFKYAAIEAVKGTKEITDPGLLQAVKDSVGERLKDPFSAEYKEVRSLPSGTICGKVNAKNGYGAYAGWSEFALLGIPMNFGGKFTNPPALLDDDSSDLASMSCLLDAL